MSRSTTPIPDADTWTLAGETLHARLLMGTGTYVSLDHLLAALEASGAEIVTVALKRVALAAEPSVSLTAALRDAGYRLLPNTAGCYTARDAVLTAELGREALETDWVKLEVIGDDRTLLPDVAELVKAAETLVGRGFQVLAYTSDDLVTALRLADAGCAAVMPLGSPIGTGRGIHNPWNLSLIRERLPSEVPVLLDAGVGTPSDVVQALELGLDAVLLSSAVSRATYPEKMAHAMRHAAIAGRQGYLAGRMPQSENAVASSPQEGRLGARSVRQRGL